MTDRRHLAGESSVTDSRHLAGESSVTDSRHLAGESSVTDRRAQPLGWLSASRGRYPVPCAAWTDTHKDPYGVRLHDPPISLHGAGQPPGCTPPPPPRAAARAPVQATRCSRAGLPYRPGLTRI